MRDVKTGMVVANIVVIALLAFVAFNFISIPLISPENGAYTTERNPEFLWGGIQGEFIVLVDDSPDFSSPFVWKVPGNTYRPSDVLNFGTYYWKVQSKNAESKVRKFTVESSVVLARDSESVKNEGNTEIMLRSITGAMVVGVGDSVKIGEEEDVEAEQA